MHDNKHVAESKTLFGGESLFYFSKSFVWIEWDDHHFRIHTYTHYVLRRM